MQIYPPRSLALTRHATKSLPLYTFRSFALYSCPYHCTICPIYPPPLSYMPFSSSRPSLSLQRAPGSKMYPLVAFPNWIAPSPPSVCVLGLQRSAPTVSSNQTRTLTSLLSTESSNPKPWDHPPFCKRFRPPPIVLHLSILPHGHGSSQRDPTLGSFPSIPLPLRISQDQWPTPRTSRTQRQAFSSGSPPRRAACLRYWPLTHLLPNQGCSPPTRAASHLQEMKPPFAAASYSSRLGARLRRQSSARGPLIPRSGPPCPRW